MGDGSAVGHPVAGSTPLDRIKFLYGGIAAAPVNFVSRAQFPTPLFIVLWDRGPPTILGLGTADLRAQ